MKYLLTLLILPLHALLVINEPTAIVYETPEINGHIEDILRYGTEVSITEENNEWAHITYKGWQGWILKNALLELKAEPIANARVGYRGAYLYTKADTEWGPSLELPFESPLEIIQELPQAYNRWVIVKLQDGQTGYMQRSQIEFSPRILSMEEMITFSKIFLGTKYLWGGTSSFGYDCSGFVQMLYRQMRITLPRNSYQQAQDSQFKDVENAQPGDLVFFSNAAGKVSHVGMMINCHEFIHSFPREESWICISSLSDPRFKNGHFSYNIKIRRININLQNCLDSISSSLTIHK